MSSRGWRSWFERMGKLVREDGEAGSRGCDGDLGYSFWRRRLITSSEVITPVRRLASSTTGKVSRLYLSKSSATSFSEALAWQEIRGSWVRASKGVAGVASTILARGTVPERVSRESTRKTVLTVSTPPSKWRRVSIASWTVAVTGRAR